MIGIKYDRNVWKEVNVDRIKEYGKTWWMIGFEINDREHINYSRVISLERRVAVTFKYILNPIMYVKIVYLVAMFLKNVALSINVNFVRYSILLHEYQPNNNVSSNLSGVKSSTNHIVMSSAKYDRGISGSYNECTCIVTMQSNYTYMPIIHVVINNSLYTVCSNVKLPLNMLC